MNHYFCHIEIGSPWKVPSGFKKKSQEETDVKIGNSRLYYIQARRIRSVQWQATDPENKRVFSTQSNASRLNPSEIDFLKDLR